MESSNTQLLGCGWTQPAQCPPTFFMICPPANAGSGQAQAQFPTLSCTFVPVVCAITQIAGCGGQAQGQGQAQAQTMYHTQVGCPVSVPPHCPTVAPMCPPPAGGAGGPADGGGHMPTIFPTMFGCVVTQPSFCRVTVAPMCPPANQNVSVATHCPTVAPMCPVTQFHCQLSAPPNCPTVGACPPNVGGQNQAQAQAATMPVAACVTTYIPTVHCTGIWPIC